MADLVMRKRPAMRAGELGLFIDAEAFEDEFASIKQGAEVTVTATQSRSIKQMRLAWSLAGKIAKSGALGDADQREVMNYLLKKAKHVRYIANQHRDGVEVEVIVKSIRFASMEQTAFNRVFNRMVYVVLSEILPDMAEGELRDEIEKMAGIVVPEPDQKPVRQRRRTAAARDPAPVSVIPDDKNPDPSSPPPAEGNTAPKATTKGVAPNENPGTPASPPPSAPNHAAVQVTPKDAAGWAVYTLVWLADFESDREKTDQDAMVRWNGERDLRNACGVTSEERQPVFEVYSATLERMRKKT